MSELENQQDDAEQICAEIGRALVGLGIDWKDETALRLLAREALAFRATAAPVLAADDMEGHTRRRLFGLIALMFRTMEEGAEVNEHVHGNDVWKALARAMWAEKDSFGK